MRGEGGSCDHVARPRTEVGCEVIAPAATPLEDTSRDVEERDQGPGKRGGKIRGLANENNKTFNVRKKPVTLLPSGINSTV